MGHTHTILNISSGDMDEVIIPTDGISLLEVTVCRSISLTTIAGQKLYLLPLGEYFRDAVGETEIDYNGIKHSGDGFYTHVHRSLAAWMNVADTCIGIVLVTPPPAGVVLTLHWKQRIFLLTPPSVALVHCSHYLGGWKPDYTITGWRQDNPTIAPNAIQVAIPPLGYVVEWWRLTQQKGGAHGPGSGYRAGKRYLPVYRGPAPNMENPALFLREQFDKGSDSRPWRHFRVCYYQPTTGYRSALSSEVIISAGSQPDQHNGKGPSRYNLWINR